MKVTVHLARLVLEPSGLRDLHEIHARLWRAFPDESARRNKMSEPERTALAAPFLFRADRVRDGASVEVRALVQSQHTPNWGCLGSAVRSIETSTSGAVSWELATGQRWGFYLRANPTRSRKDQHQRVGVEDSRAFAELSREEFREARGRRVGLLGDPDREAWLLRKLQGAATVPTRVSHGDDGAPTETRELRLANLRPWRWRHGRVVATHEGADFQGVLVVEDPARLAALLTAGVGAGKGLGFGLLSLRAVPP